jgi:hypothetical protein
VTPCIYWLRKGPYFLFLACFMSRLVYDMVRHGLSDRWMKLQFFSSLADQMWNFLWPGTTSPFILLLFCSDVGDSPSDHVQEDMDSEVYPSEDGEYFVVALRREYHKVPFCDGLFYEDSLLQTLSSRTEHSRLVVHHCHNWSIICLLSALLALFWCACVFSYSILVQFF